MKGNFIMYFRLLSFTWQRHFKIFDICINNTREQSRAEKAGSVAEWQAKPSWARLANMYNRILVCGRPIMAATHCSPGIGQIKKRRHYAKYAQQLPYRSVEFHETETMSHHLTSCPYAEGGLRMRLAEACVNKICE